MRKLSIVLATLGALWIGATAGAVAWAEDDSSTVHTTVSKESVTADGEQLDQRERTDARLVPDGTNLVSVTWEGDPEAEFRVETRRAGGRWIDRGKVGLAFDLPDAGTADARRAAAGRRVRAVSRLT